jgi:HlyD family secretion protein
MLHTIYRPWPLRRVPLWQFLRPTFGFLLLIAALQLSGCGSPPAVRTITVESGVVESTVSSVNAGTVRAEQIAELAFGAVGRVKRLSVALGDSVNAGQILAEIENHDLKTALETAEAEYARRLELLRVRALSQSEVDDARRIRDLALINYQKSQIIAPYDGIITELNLEVGQLSQITAVIPKALIRIVDTEPRYVRAEIDEVDLPRVKVGMQARVRILAARREAFSAKVRKVVPFISSLREQDRTAEIELEVDPEGMLLPAGASADVEVVVDVAQDTLTVPSRVVLGRGDARYVYRLENGRAVRTAVTIGLYNYDVVQILDGLQRGDRVIYPSEGIDLEDGQEVVSSERA